MIKLEPFSEKQLRVMRWWTPGSPDRSRVGIICDGAVRSGKTLCMSLSFILWSMTCFDGGAFALCGHTVTALRRNIVTPLLPLLEGLGFCCDEKLSENRIVISRGGVSNRYYCFGGRDRSSAAHIQGMTLCGALLDEVAVMNREFAEQTAARCSHPDARLWFNCNPDSPEHWFRREWILKKEAKNCLHLTFTMDDNPSLTEEVKARYRSMYTGVFYRRFILGEWAVAEGLVYPGFGEGNIRPYPEKAGKPEKAERSVVSCDYGTVNPTSMGLWSLCGGVWYRVREYWFDSATEGTQRTDEEYYAALEKLCAGENVGEVIIDPSAASFIACVRKHGRFRAVPAVNSVADGIRHVSEALRSGRIDICPGCANAIREFALYSWTPDSARDVPIKKNDHAMDDIRYFTETCLYRRERGVFALGAEGGKDR